MSVPFLFFHNYFYKDGLNKVPEETTGTKSQLSLATLVKSMTKLNAGRGFKARQKILIDQKKNVGENVSYSQDRNNEPEHDNKLLHPEFICNKKMSI